MTKPRVAIVHALGRCGSTLLARCLGSMKGVMVIGEVHPLGLAHFDPLRQAREWYAMPPEQVEGFVPKIQQIAAFAQQREMALVLRDWTYLDFVGKPYVESPSGRLMTAEVLAESFDLRQVCLVRHPLYQRRNDVTLAAFLPAHRRFAEHAVTMGFVRYEDLTASPTQMLMGLCLELGIPFDPGFIDRWHEYVNFTGHHGGPNDIAPPLPREMSADVLTRAETSVDYQASLAMLNYGHPR